MRVWPPTFSRMAGESHHDRLWARHPAVATGDELSQGERAADAMKHYLATWPALGLTLVVIVVWLVTGAFGIDPSPWFRLNLGLSCFAALQCFILLIANKRGEQRAAALALHSHTLLTELRTLSTCLHGQGTHCTCTQEESAP